MAAKKMVQGLESSEVNAILECIDTDHDGVVDLYEFQKAGGSKEEFNAIDINKSGYLERDEIFASSNVWADIMISTPTRQDIRPEDSLTQPGVAALLYDDFSATSHHAISLAMDAVEREARAQKKRNNALWEAGRPAREQEEHRQKKLRQESLLEAMRKEKSEADAAQLKAQQEILEAEYSADRAHRQQEQAEVASEEYQAKQVELCSLQSEYQAAVAELQKTPGGTAKETRAVLNAARNRKAQLRVQVEIIHFSHCTILSHLQLPTFVC